MSISKKSNAFKNWRFNSSNKCSIIKSLENSKNRVIKLVEGLV